MKGIVFNLFEAVFSAEYGEDAWDDLLEQTKVDGAYSSLGTYDDNEFLGLVQAATETTGIDVPEIVRWFGQGAIPLMVDRFPDLFASHRDTRAFLLTLNDVIHPEVRKLYPEADVPTFDYDNSDDRVLVMSYQSKRKLCDFAIGLMEGAAKHYAEKIEIAHPECMKRGHERCLFRIQFGGERP